MVTRFQLRSSRQLASLIAILYGGACLILLKIPLAKGWKIMGFMVTLGHFAYLWHHLIRLSSATSVSIFWKVYTGEWRLANQQGLIKNAQLETHTSLCTQHFIILNFKILETAQSSVKLCRRLIGPRQTIIVLTDSLAQADLKALRRLLFFDRS